MASVVENCLSASAMDTGLITKRSGDENNAKATEPCHRYSPNLISSTKDPGGITTGRPAEMKTDKQTPKSVLGIEYHPPNPSPSAGENDRHTHSGVFRDYAVWFLQKKR